MRGSERKRERSRSTYVRTVPGVREPGVVPWTGYGWRSVFACCCRRKYVALVQRRCSAGRHHDDVEFPQAVRD